MGPALNALYRSPLWRPPGYTAQELLGGALVHEWDFGEPGAVTVATGVSSIADKVAGGFALTQATGSAQPPFTAAGRFSYATGDGISQYLGGNGADLTGGDLVLMLVARRISGAGTSSALAMGQATTNRSNIGSTVTAWRAQIRDSSGNDIQTTGSVDTNLHARIVYNNSVGLVRKMWIDGGSGAALNRTGVVSSIHTHVGLFAQATTTPGEFSNTDIFWAGIAKPVFTLAQLNAWGNLWYVPRFSSIGATWSTAT